MTETTNDLIAFTDAALNGETHLYNRETLRQRIQCMVGGMMQRIKGAR